MQVGFEDLGLWQSREAADAGGYFPRTCVGLSIPASLDLSRYNHREVEIDGTFLAELPERQLVLGGCNLTTLEMIEGVSPVVIPVAAPERAAPRTEQSPLGIERIGAVVKHAGGSIKTVEVLPVTIGGGPHLARFEVPPGTQTVMHGHPPERGLRDAQNRMGDADVLAKLGVPSIVVAADGRLAAHEIVEGRYHLRALEGEFEPAEGAHFRREVDGRQSAFNALNLEVGTRP